MEQVHGTHNESKFKSKDIISTMPENVITNILNRLPLGDALATALLARNWRLKWTLLTELVFDKEFFDLVDEFKEEYDWTIISSLLLHIKGPVTKFVLYVPCDNKSDLKDIIHWVLFLSKRGMNEFTLINMHRDKLKLPSHLLSCLELKHLKLCNCCLNQAPSFCGFPNLLSLDLYRVTIEGENCGKFITQCPLLEMLEISYHDPTRKVKLVEIAKLGNLIKLSLPLCKLDDIAITSSSIFQLGTYLPKLQELFLDFRNHKFIGEVSARKWGCTFFPCLKSLTLHPIDFNSDTMLSCLFEMIQGSPNLQILNIKAAYDGVIPPPAFSFPKVDNNTMGPLQLQHVVFSSFRGSENEEVVEAPSSLHHSRSRPLLVFQSFEQHHPFSVVWYKFG
uniref:F-box/FBD/LRR-repeat protein At1g13570-like isoform X2 n=1 Tax=Erigeron canadensis TaxID=72917 RepID=UPI001CB9AD32|nr:F-box/FBD/LRR-repeat protein At1g13570-like isoform X2 [Erigeron canadensis]